MTHKSIPADKRRAAGVADSLIRLSVGLEDVIDLVKDLELAFEKLKTNNRSKIKALTVH
jgi:cystathionine beta-lyase